MIGTSFVASLGMPVAVPLWVTMASILFSAYPSPIDTFRKELSQVMHEKGPVFTVLDIEPDETHLSAAAFSKHVRSRDAVIVQQFREALRS